MNALSALRPFADGWRPVAPSGERCRMCAQLLDGDDHEHVVDVGERSLRCVCASCAALFVPPWEGPSPPEARYRVVPKRVLDDPAFRLDDRQWAALRIPVGLAFVFFNSSLDGWVVIYPSPAGATEAELEPEGLVALDAATPLLAEAEPDVEALLLHARRGQPSEALLVPIDACYELVGQVRVHWQGMTGGDAVWREVDRLLGGLRARAESVERRR
jgi:hypothetical protein